MSREEFVMEIVFMSNIKNLACLFLIFTTFSFAQSDQGRIDKAFKYIREGNFDKAKSISNVGSENNLLDDIIEWEITLKTKGINDEKLHKKIIGYHSDVEKFSLVLKNYHLADYYLYFNQQDLSYKYYDKVLNQAKKISDSVLICKALNNLLELATRNKNLEKYVNTFIDDYKSYSYNDLERMYCTYYKQYFRTIKEGKFDLKSHLSALKQVKKLNNDYCLLTYYQRIGIGHDIYLKNSDSAIYYYNLSLKIIIKNKGIYFVEQKRKGILNNLGCLSFDKNSYGKALSYFQDAYAIRSSKKRLMNDSIITDWLAKTHVKLNNVDSALYYYQKKDTISRELGQATYAANIEELKSKYDIDKANQNIVTLMIIFIAFAVVSLLVFFNLKRKQLLAKREKQLEKEKLEKLLNEQELVGINAMVEGQEEERKRIANELHDDLGSNMATLRLYAENARDKNEQIVEIHDKMLHIIDDVYQRVRGMAHTRNSGVKGSKGLLPAIEHFADKISDSDQLHIEVAAFNMNKHYDSELELEIFRIIKELITNVIKHADAEEVLIQLTQHEDYLNVMVQDNGKGFDSNKIHQDDGMGLYSIEKRIESKNGTMLIDSSFVNGTTITLNIPTDS